MASITPAIGIQSGSHDAKNFRQLPAALAGSEVETFAGGVSAVAMGHGLVRSGHLAVTENGSPNMSVNVAKGSALITGTSSLAQGVYCYTNDATENLVIATADNTNPRWDLVVVQIRDNIEDGGGNNDARLAVITGTPAASPADPAIPAGCLVLARVVVPALDGSIGNAQITMLAGLARGSNWNVAWGEVAYGVAGTSDVGGISSTPSNIIAATWTAVTGRKYKTSVEIVMQKDATPSAVQAAINNGVGIVRQRSETADDSEFITMVCTLRETGLAGAQTRTLQASCTSGGATYVGTSGRQAHIIVEDIGPA